MKGLREIFCFTLREQLKIKTVKRLTIIVSLLLLLAPPSIMGITELRRDKNAEGENASAYSAEGVNGVFAAAETEDGIDWSVLEMIHLPGYEAVPFTFCESLEDAEKQAERTEGSLVLFIREREEEYSVKAILPEGSTLTDEHAEFLADACMQGWEPVMLFGLGLSEEQITDAYLAMAEDMENLAGGNPEDEDEMAEKRLILYRVFPYVNVMLIYFMVLYYGQSVANSVILEKSSKLMDTFLVAVNPRSLIFGKVLATWLAALIQLLSWIVSLLAGVLLGKAIVLAINPDSPMGLLMLLDYLKEASGALSLPDILLAVLILIGGFFVYCTLAAIAGSFASKPEELSSTISYFTLILVASMLITFKAGFINPVDTGEIITGAAWYDFVPFTAVLLTPSRALLGSVSRLTALGSFAVMAALSGVLIVLAGKCYTMMSLYKGNVPKLPQIVKMLKAKDQR